MQGLSDSSQDKREAHKKEAKKKRYEKEGQPGAQKAIASWVRLRKDAKRRKAMMMD